MQTEVELLGVGDVMIRREEPLSAFALARNRMRKADIMFGNCEAIYAEANYDRNPSARGQGTLCPPKNVAALVDGGFHVMSFANNHSFDFGYGGFRETRQRLQDAGILIGGAGNDLDEARRPIIYEAKGTRVAFLCYNSILFPGYAAARNKAGITPLNIFTYYEQIEHEQPASKPRIRSQCKPEDMAALREDIQRARELADIVVISPHWGIHFTPVTIAEYEMQIARDAIDAGADIVMGHHQHILKGVEIYKGKPIFYGLGNFLIDTYMLPSQGAPVEAGSDAIKEMVSNHGAYGVAYRPDTPSYPFHADARQTMIARFVLKGGEIVETSYLPTYINNDGQPQILAADDPLFDQVADYVTRITAEAGLKARFERQGDRVIVHQA